MIIDKECIESEGRVKLVVAEENGKVYRLVNLSLLNIKKIKVDGCFERKNGEELCDYLMCIDKSETRRAIFVELKGRKFEKAVKQICSTIDLLKKELDNFQIDARIVATRLAPDYKNISSYKDLVKKTKPWGSVKHSTNGFYSETV